MGLFKKKTDQELREELARLRAQRKDLKKVTEKYSERDQLEKTVAQERSKLKAEKFALSKVGKVVNAAAPVLKKVGSTLEKTTRPKGKQPDYLESMFGVVPKKTKVKNEFPGW